MGRGLVLLPALLLLRTAGGVAAPSSSPSSPSSSSAAAAVAWRVAKDYGGALLHGKGTFAQGPTEHYYDRLPAASKNTTRPVIYELQQQPAGLFLQFTTNSTAVSLNYTLGHAGLGMWHFAPTGVSGMDAYVFDDAADHRAWRWVGTAHPAFPVTTAIPLTPRLTRCGAVCPERLYRIHLPTYNTVGDDLALGLDPGATFTPDGSHMDGLFPAAGPTGKILWYGSSILQGAVASRPGQIMTHILSRNLSVETYNFGFSGSCWMEPEVAQYMSVVPDVQLIVVDCNPNMAGFHPPSIDKRTVPLVAFFRQHGHPNTPIILTEGTPYGAEWSSRTVRAGQANKSAALRARFEELVAGGDQHLYYSRGPPLFADSLGMAADVAGGAALLVDPTVGGTHPTDLGMRKQAAYWANEIPKVLAADRKKRRRHQRVRARGHPQRAAFPHNKSPDAEPGIGHAVGPALAAAEGIRSELAMGSGGAATPSPAVPLRWFDGTDFLQGRAEYVDDNGTVLPRRSAFDRLPAAADGVVRDEVFRLAQDSTGMYLRFTTDAERIVVNHTDAFGKTNLWHMPESGTDSLDVYAWSEGDGVWRHIPVYAGILAYGGAGPQSGVIPAPQPASTDAEGSTASLVTYLVYLPLRNAPAQRSLSVGVGRGDVLCGAAASTVPCGAGGAPADPAPAFTTARVAWYGTSIQQGGVASRAGTEYDAIIARRLSMEILNLGFAGNGVMELSVAEFLVKAQGVSLIVIDCLPNMGAAQVANRTGPLVHYLRAHGHKATPIVLAEGTPYPAEWLNGAPFSDAAKNAALKAAYEILVAGGDEHLHYVESADLFRPAAAGLVNPTVGGTHSSDLGQYMIADYYVRALPRILAAAEDRQEQQD